MPTWDAVRREHVLQAIAEYDRLGQLEFLQRYRFGQATGYLLIVDGRDYDSKAIAGVACQYAIGAPLTSADFSGGRDGAAGVLRRLGFQVNGPDDAPGHAKSAGTYRAADGSPVAFPDAQQLWVSAARERLISTSRVYHAVTTYKELAEEIQVDTGVRTRMLLMNWIGAVLGLVADDCARRGEPLLSALCVNQEGSVGPGYAPSIASLRGLAPADADDHAAHERLACYRHFGAALPLDGGRPALSPVMQSRRDRAASQRPERRGAICPTCFVELPVSRRCMTCDN